MENQITTNAAKGKRLSKFTLLLMMGVATVAFVAGLAVRGSRQSPPCQLRSPRQNRLSIRPIWLTFPLQRSPTSNS